MESGEIPALIGTRMAKAAGLGLNDITTLRWREPGGSFNALDIRIVQVMNTTVASIDQNQIWLPLAKLQAMARLPQEATLLVVSRAVQSPPALSGWSFKNLDFLLQELREMIKTKGYGRTFLFSILMAMGLLAIFDTQVLAIFRRRKEIGTLIALGFTRGQVIRLFTLEGALYGVLAVILGTILGTPLLIYQAKSGLSLPAGTEDFGFAISEKIFPVYSAGLILGTVLIALLAITVVSLLPTRRIAKMKPTDALRGRTS
jgi:ABC-type lipoprotein release transport system permease subunit